MTGPVVAVHAVHAPSFALRELIWRDTLGDVLAHGAGTILDPHIGDRLPRVIRGDVLDLVGGIGVPVNARHAAGLLSSHVELQRRHRFTVLLVVGVISDPYDLVSMGIRR